jgi:hypothetical protein
VSVSVLIRYRQGGEERELIVCLVYLPYDSPNLSPGEKLRQLVNFTNEKGTPIVVECDANSHHVAWNMVCGTWCVEHGGGFSTL